MKKATLTREKFQKKYRDYMVDNASEADTLAQKLNEAGVKDDFVVVLNTGKKQWTIMLGSAYEALEKGIHDNVPEGFSEEDYTRTKNEAARGIAATALLINFIVAEESYVCRLCHKASAGEMLTMQHIASEHYKEIKQVVAAVDAIVEVEQELILLEENFEGTIPVEEDTTVGYEEAT